MSFIQIEVHRLGTKLGAPEFLSPDPMSSPPRCELAWHRASPGPAAAAGKGAVNAIPTPDTAMINAPENNFRIPITRHS
ncbi:hypothetical protein [Actinoplanes sp. NPDC020271]|uniref:hypothetical protein n=1 Tax=Actinoplanes sp. NPDC020271 TaxID=3363896 RepID=UPI0037A760F7